MPTRYLKQGICDSDRIDKCSPMAECLYYRLLVNVDDFGRLDARPAVVKAKCFPLKENLLHTDVYNLLQELYNCMLIQIYSHDDKKTLQITKWDNKPRATASKYPEPPKNIENTRVARLTEVLHTDVKQLHTSVPLTVTGTETVTETVNRKPEPEPEPEHFHADQKPKPTSIKKSAAKEKQPPTPLQMACMETWRAYSNAYFSRYGAEPVRNAKVNGQIKLFVGRVGVEEAPHIAAHYLASNMTWHVSRGHSLDCLLMEAEKLRTEWATGRSMTATRSRQIDQHSANASIVDEAMEIYARMKREKDEGENGE